MCEPLTMGLIGGALLGSMQKTPSIPAPPAPEAPPQASKTPDTQEVLSTMKGTGQAGGSPGVAQTFLSGNGGVDQNSLVLNKKTLLG